VLRSKRKDAMLVSYVSGYEPTAIVPASVITSAAVAVGDVGIIVGLLGVAAVLAKHT
jgi:hypothetical protein